MHDAFIPRYICNEIHKKCRKFISGDSDNHQSVHLVNWKKLCSPKDNSGLGLREARYQLDSHDEGYLESNCKQEWSAR